MQALKIGILTVFLGISANAFIVKNPVDLSPTAIHNSGATYGPNVVTSLNHPPVAQNEESVPTIEPANAPENASEAITYDDLNRDVPVLNHPVRHRRSNALGFTTTQSSANLNTVSPEESTDATTLNAVPNQQAQQVAPTHTAAMAWSIALLAVIVIGGIMYFRNRDESDPISRNLR